MERDDITAEVIAQLGWETHAEWENIIGEAPSLSWDDLIADHKADLTSLVQWILDHPMSSISEQHDHWRAWMASKGRDNANMVGYDDLPFDQQMKARLWRHIVHAVVG